MIHKTSMSVLAKAFLSLLLIVALAFGSTAAFASDNVKPPVIVMNGVELNLPGAPLIRDGITYVPAQPFLESLDMTTGLLDELGIGTSGSDNTAVTFGIGAYKQGISIEFEKDGHMIVVNGVKHLVKQSSFTENNICYIPLRFTAEAVNAKVAWDSNGRVISVEWTPEAATLRLFIPHAEPYTQSQLQAINDYSLSVSQARLDIQHGNENQYREQILVRIASGDLPDLMVIPDALHLPMDLYSAFSRDLSPWIDGYPHLAALNPMAMEELQQDLGGLYALPVLQSREAAPFLALRKDWLNVLDLQVPETMDELTQVMREFTERDPDGNGRNDTYGLSPSWNGYGLGGFEWVDRIFTNSSSRFQLVDDKIIDTVTLEGTREALAWLQEAYRQGWIHPEWAALSRDDAQDQLRNGISGGAALTLDQITDLQEHWDSTKQKASLVPLVSLQADEEGPTVTARGKSYGGVLAFSQFTKTDAEIQQLLTLLDALAAPGDEEHEGKQLLREALLHFYTGVSTDVVGGPSAPLATILEQRQAVVTTQSDPVTLEAWIKDARGFSHYVLANEKIKEMRIKVILGVSLDEWDTFVAGLVEDPDYKQMLDNMQQSTK